MGARVTYAEIPEHAITESQAMEMYGVLAKYPEDYLSCTWRVQIDKRWGNGEEMPDLMRRVLAAAYRWHEKAMYMSPFAHENTVKMCLDLYAVAGIEPPEHPGRGVTHGGEHGGA